MAIVGIAGYAVIALLAVFGRLWSVLHLAEVGFLCACFLSYLEAFVMEKWCIYCVLVQARRRRSLLTTILALFLERRAAEAEHLCVTLTCGGIGIN